MNYQKPIDHVGHREVVYSFTHYDDDNACADGPASGQMSLLGAFWCTTLFCTICGLHNFCGPAFSLGFAIVFVVYGVLRIFPCTYGVTGGLVAFLTSLLCLPVAVVFGGLSSLSQIVLTLMMPCVAFMVGAFLTEWQEER